VNLTFAELGATAALMIAGAINPWSEGNIAVASTKEHILEAIMFAVFEERLRYGGLVCRVALFR